MMQSEPKERSRFEELDRPTSRFEKFDAAEEVPATSKYQVLDTLREAVEETPMPEQPLMIEQPRMAHPGWLGEMFGIPMVRLPIPGIDPFMRAEEAAIKFAIDVEERPRRMAMNLGHLFWESKGGAFARLMARTRMPREETVDVEWDDIKKAIVDGWQGVQYSTLWEQMKRSGATRAELEKYEQFLKRHKGLRYADRTANVVGELASAIVLEGAMYGGIRGALRRAPLVKGIFAEVPEKVLKEGLDEAMEYGAQRIIKRGQFFDALDNIYDNPTLYNEFNWDVLAATFHRDVRLEFLERVTKPRVKGAQPLVSKDTVRRLSDAISLGKTKSYRNLSPAELAALTDDVGVLLQSPRGMSLLTQIGVDWGGVPSWSVLERLGLRRGYDAIDDAMYTVTVRQADRAKWVSDTKRAYKKTFGKKWDDATDEIAARLADEGPRAEIPRTLLNKTSKGEMDFLRTVIEEDRAMFWEPLADLAERMGLIGGKTGITRQEFYYHHRQKLFDFLQRRVKDKNYIMPADYRIERASRRRIPVKVNVPEFMVRQGTGEINYAWSDVTRIAFREELRRLHLEPAAQRLSALVDASPVEIRRAAQEYTSEWMRYVRGMPSPWDEKLNRLTAKGVEILTLGRVQVGQRAFERFSNSMRRLIISGTIGGNPRSIVKNMTQSLLTINTIGHRATVAGWESLFTEGGRRLLGKYNVMAGGRRLAMAEINIATRSGWERLSTLGFAAVDKYINCSGAGNGALWRLVTRSSKHMDELVEYGAKQGISASAVRGAKFWDVLADAIDDGKFKELVQLANRNIKVTQYSYMPWDMPRHLWGQAGKNTWMFTTWPSNFFGVHMPQLWQQLIKGKDVFGATVTPAQRVALITFIAKGSALFYMGRKLGYNLDYLFVAGPIPSGRIHGYLEVPAPVSPPVEFATAFGSMVVGGLTLNDRLIDSGITGLKNVFPAFLPLGTVGRQAIRAARGKVPFEAIILPKRIKPKKALRWRMPPGLPTLPE